MLNRCIKFRGKKIYLIEAKGVVNQRIIEIYEGQKYVGCVDKNYRNQIDILVQYILSNKSYEEIGVYA